MKALLIDLQTKLLPALHENEALLANSIKLLKGLNLLEVELLYSEQYPKGLGSTDEALLPHLQNAKRYEKREFSCFANEDFMNDIQASNPQGGELIIFGAEAHVCVYQTVRDATYSLFDVYIVEECISSRTPQNKALAIDAMKELGASIVSIEMLLFCMMQTSTHSKFKEISALIK